VTATQQSVTDRALEVRPEQLVSRGKVTRVPALPKLHGPRAKRMARSLAHAALDRIARDQLIIREQRPGESSESSITYGRSNPELVGEIIIRDERAYVSLITEGAIGLGRGFIEGWWESPDPVTAVRVIIRNVAPIDAVRNKIHRRTGWLTDRLRAVRPRRGRSGNREDIAAHYDLGNPFFELFLDETMTYSSAVFPSPDATLAEGSLHKYDTLLGKLAIDQTHRLLEIGTGWGGLAIRAAQTVGCDVTTTTISAEQFAEAKRRVADAGHNDRVKLLDADWRDLTGTFDRVISIEMIEAVDWRDYDDFFASIEQRMKPDGLAVIQAICFPDNRYDRAKNTEDFILRFIFPNGCLASIGAITKSVSRATRMQVIDVEEFSWHYAETLRRWHARFDERIDDVRALGLDDRFCRLWKFYFAYCEAGFRERHVTVNQIVIAGRNWRGSI
jgi:cyclopropane-fatty-acyl-phospholipid synthase